MMRKKKILQVTSCFQIGGTEAYIMNNFRNINKDQFQFDFWFFRHEDSPYADEIRSLGGNIYYGELPSANNIIPFIKSLVKHIKENGPYDAIHAHINIANAWVMFAAFLARIKIRISHSHSTAGKDTKSIIKKIYFKFQEYIIKIFATKKIACSKIAGDYLYGENYFMNYGQVCNNGIDINNFLHVDKYNIEVLKKEFFIPEDNFVIGNITRFDLNKNTQFVVAVFKEILRIKSNSILILGGVDGGQLSSIKEKVHILGMDDKVRFIGVRKDINVCLKLLNAYIFPSLFEGLPIALLEVQAGGLQCYASTEVSKEVDMGLGTVTFLDMNKGERYWAEYILDHYIEIDLDEAGIRDAFDNAGYSIHSSVVNLEKIYAGLL